MLPRLDRIPFGRVPVLLTALSAGAALLAGCGSGPSQVGAAAIVGSSSVSLADAQQRVDEVLKRPDIVRHAAQDGATAADLARTVVSNEIQHLLLAEAARREQIVVEDRQIDAELARPGTADRLAGKLVLNPAQAREALRDELVARALTMKYLNRLTVTMDLLITGTRAEATDKARHLAAGPAQAAAVLAGSGKDAQAGLRLRPALVPQEAAQFLFGVPAGQVVALQTRPSPEEWVVLRVTRRDLNGAPPGDPNQSSLSQLDPFTMDQIGRRFTQPLAEELGVRANPRYGTWDPVYLAIVPPGQQPSLVLPAVLS